MDIGNPASAVDATALRLEWCGPTVSGGPGSVVATGVFDLLHVGHLRFLTAARQAGRRLIVGVEDDARTHARKGFGRPIIPALERCELLTALRQVDGVFLISGPASAAPVEAYAGLLRQLEPAAIAFTEGDPAEAGKRRVAQALGAGVRVVPRVDGRSTTMLVELFSTSAVEPPDRLADAAIELAAGTVR